MTDMTDSIVVSVVIVLVMAWLWYLPLVGFLYLIGVLT